MRPSRRLGVLVALMRHLMVLQLHRPAYGVPLSVKQPGTE